MLDAAPPLREKNLAWFVDHFITNCKNDDGLRFCFILGAGASFSSGIPTAEKLAREWVDRLVERHRAEGADSLCGERNWDPKNLAAHYFDVYDECFDYAPNEGFQAIDDAISRSPGPSIGYSILARILTRTRSNFAITVNFDNLIADAIFLYSSAYPRLCFHESLATFARPMLGKPVIAKVHRDRALHPVNPTGEDKNLRDEWAKALRNVFREFVPVFIGYGANDGSLMGFLNLLAHESFEFPAPPIWLHFSPKGKVVPGEALPFRDFLAKTRGVIIPHIGFDETMYEIANAFSWKLDEIRDQLRKRMERQELAFDDFLRKSVSMITEKTDEASTLSGSAKEALKGIAHDADPITYYIRAEGKSASERLEIYSEGIQAFPEAYALYNNRAIAKRELKDFEGAIRDYERAIELRPEYAEAFNNRGNVKLDQHDYRGALEDYDQAVGLKPDYAQAYDNRGIAKNKLKDFHGAIADHKQALKLDPKRSSYNVACAYSLNGQKEDALEYLRKAIEQDEDYRAIALKDDDFESLKEHPAFLELVQAKAPADREPSVR